MDIIWKKLKILTYPFNSYYSFCNPEKKLKEYDERILFSEVGESNDKLDKIRLLKSSIYNNVNKEESTEKWILSQMNALAEYFLTIRNNRLYIDENEKYVDRNFFNIHVAEGENAKKYMWYYLKRISNKDILKACFVQKNFSMNGAEIEFLNRSILTADPLLESILQKGISETHMHAGAGRSFSFLWIDIMNKKLSVDIEIVSYEGLVNIKNHLLLAQLIRTAATCFLNGQTKPQRFQNSIDEKYKESIDYFYTGNIRYDEEFEARILGEIESYKREKGICVLNIESEDTLRQLTLKSDLIVKVLDDYYYQDIDNQFHCKYGNENEIIFPENVFLLKSLEYLSENDDSYFCRIFIQYIRLKNIFEQYIRQQDDGGKGLDIFKLVYNRQSKLNLRNSFGEVLYTHLESQNITKMEIRITPLKEGEIEKIVKTILKEYYQLLVSNQYSESSFPLIGLVFHFIKEKSNGNNKCFFLFEQLNKEKYLNYGDVKSKNKVLSHAIQNLLNRIPEIGFYIVGIDAASGENDTEPYVFKEIFETFRTTENMHNKKYLNNRLSNTVGFTYHVGEDFRDIISGLRHIDEVIDHYKFIPGDRIGHGIVIGIDIDKWSETNKTVFLPINEYLDDLLWEWGCYNNYEGLKNSENTSYLENCIYKAAEEIFGHIEGLNVRDLYDLYLSKFRNNSAYYLEGCIEEESKRKYKIENKCVNKCSENSKWNRAKLERAINCKYFLASLEKNVSVEINNYRVKRYKKLQEFMKNKLSKRGIIIEVNPTSNILIGEFDSYRDFNLESLSSPKEEKVIITINTDDPITFNTKLSNEYSLLMDLMTKNGKYTRKETLVWIDKLRQNGNDFSFIKNREMSKSSVIEEIKRIIDKL